MYALVMEIAPKPENEVSRLEAVRSLGLIDTPPEERFDRFTRFARLLFNVPIAYVSLIGDEIQWFKSVQGMDISQTPRELSFCSHTILTDQMMVVEDTIKDSRFNDHPIVVNPPHIRFYAGVRLNLPNGICVGTFCLADIKPKYPTEEEIKLLGDLGRMLEQEFQPRGQLTTDELTGLSNRKGFLLIAQHAIAICERNKSPVTLMYFSLDNLKTVIKDFGQAEGEKVLRDVGQLLLSEFRNSDVVARIGEGRFCVLLTNTNTVKIEKPLQNLANALREENVNLPYTVEYSVGAIPFDSQKHRNVDDMLKAADSAMKAS